MQFAKGLLMHLKQLDRLVRVGVRGALEPRLGLAEEELGAVGPLGRELQPAVAERAR